MLRTLVLVSFLGLATTASADAIGPCPDGEEVVRNPIEPGAESHGGYHCERSGACSVLAVGAGAPTPWRAAALLFGLVLARR